MNRLFNAFLLVTILALSGCATTANYEKMLTTWIGAPEIDLYRSWGTPDGQYEVSGTKFVTFTRGGNMIMPGTAPTYQTTFVGNTAFTNAYGGSPAYNIQLTCRTTFEIRNERVVSWRWEGNNCKAKDPS